MRAVAMVLLGVMAVAVSASGSELPAGFVVAGQAKTQLAGDKLGSKVFVPSFRVAFQVAGKVTASTRESYALGTNRSGTRVTSNTALSGIDLAQMQAITDAAYADFLQRLQDSGFEVLDDQVWGAAASAGKLDWGPTSAPGAVVTVESNSGATEVAYVLVTPTGVRNWPETAMPANLGTLRALKRELDATPVIPRFVVNYVAMTSSGKGKSGFFSRGSEVSVKPSIHAAMYAGGFKFDNWRARVGQHGGFIDFKLDTVLEAPGAFAEVDETDGDAGTRAGNAANALTWALAGVGTFSEAQYLTYHADAARYATLAGQVLAMQSEVVRQEMAKARR